MEFLGPTADSRCERNPGGQITAVQTPTKRKELLLKRWSGEDFEKAILGVDQRSPEGRHLPGVPAWQFVKKQLQPMDQIWTFGCLDTGFVVIRAGRLYCMVVVDHQW
jgi:hypothetical protein